MDKQDKFKQIFQFVIMNLATVESVRIISQYQFNDCYIVMGNHVSNVKSISSKQEFLDQIQAPNYCIFNQKLAIQLWRYQPQQLIKKWPIYEVMEKMNELIYVFTDEVWQILLKIRTIPQKLIPKPKQSMRSDSLKQLSTKSNSKSKSRNKKTVNCIKKALKEKINLLTAKPQPKASIKDHYQNYYSTSSSKYPSFFTNTSNSQTQINQTCLEYCAQKKLNEFYNIEAQNIYGFDGPKQVKFKQIPNNKPKSRQFQSFY